MKNVNEALQLLIKIQDETGCTIRDIAKVIEAYEKAIKEEESKEEN